MTGALKRVDYLGQRVDSVGAVSVVRWCRTLKEVVKAPLSEKRKKQRGERGVLPRPRYSR